MTDITDHLAQVEGRIAAALERAGRSRDDTILVAVSKKQSVESIREAYAAGQRHFGESYVQELRTKAAALEELDIVWHFVGRIQANKTRDIARYCDWVHTLDRARIAVRLNEQSAGRRSPLNVLIQINQAGETQKAGIAESEALALANEVRKLDNLRLRGLMCLPPAACTSQERAQYFAALATAAARLAQSGFVLDTLSMGMSADFELALASGSNCVRIGTAIFGDRKI